jgi:DNA-binding LacI/PurR family transcriptional regulator
MEIKKPVSIDDVARVAGVAPSTVSKTLNRIVQRRKPTEIQLRIRRVAAELGYRPNHTARSLSRGETNIIGLYWGFDFNTLDPFFGQFINGIRAGCRKHLKDVLMHGTHHKHPLNDLYDELTDGKTDGLVMYPWSKNETVTQRLAESQFPVVTVAIQLPNMPVVRVDGESGMRIAVKELAARGHRSIVYRNVLYGQDTDTRFVAFREAAARLNLSYVQTHAIDWVGRLSDEEKAIWALPRPNRPTAAVCFNDTFAYRLLAHCARVGLKSPADVAVVGFDGAFAWHEHTQRLATIVAPWEEAAEAAVDLLVDRIHGKAIPPETVLPVSWADGDTV